MTNKERVGAKPAGQKITGTWVSVPARRAAWAVKDGPLYVDGAAGPTGEGARGVSFSADGKHIAYYLKRGAFGHLVVDDVDRAVFTGFGMLAPTWSDAGLIAFTARKDDGWWVVVDGEPRFGPFTDDQPGFGFGKSRLAWSPKGLAYVAVRGDSMRVELDGAPLGELFPLVRDPIFSPSGGTAYRARRDDKWWVVANGTLLGPYDDCAAPVFAPDGKLYFAASDGEVSHLYVDGAAVAEHPKIHDVAVATGAYALVTSDDSGRRVVHAGNESDAYSNLLGLAITPDGAHTSAVATKDGQDHVLLDGAVIASASTIPHMSTSLSADGAHVAFLVKGAPSFVQIDEDVKSEPFDNLFSEIAFAPDGKSVTFLAEQADDMLVFTLDAGPAKKRTPTLTPAPAPKARASTPPVAVASSPPPAVEAPIALAPSPPAEVEAPVAVDAATEVAPVKKKAAAKKAAPKAKVSVEAEEAPAKPKKKAAAKKK